MLELTALLVYLARIIALVRSRGRSNWWAFGALMLWLACGAFGWWIAPSSTLLATGISLFLALVTATLFYRMVTALEPVEALTHYGRGHNFPCPLCASLQTEDHSGHLACHACGGTFGR